MADDGFHVRLAQVSDADEIARLLDDFNREYDCATPGPHVLAERLRTLLAADSSIALLAGRGPSVGVALVTLRPNVWYAGSVALLDELYVVPDLRGQGIGSAMIAHLLSTLRSSGVELVEINVDEGDVDAQRFYLRHGFSWTDPDTHDRAFYFSQQLTFCRGVAENPCTRPPEVADALELLD